MCACVLLDVVKQAEEFTLNNETDAENQYLSLWEEGVSVPRAHDGLKAPTAKYVYNPSVMQPVTPCRNQISCKHAALSAAVNSCMSLNPSPWHLCKLWWQTSCNVTRSFLKRVELGLFLSNWIKKVTKMQEKKLKSRVSGKGKVF